MFIGTGFLDLAWSEGAHGDRGDSEAEALKIGEWTGSGKFGVILTLGRGHVIEKSAVLVEIKNEHHAVPLRTILQRIVDLREKTLRDE